tara:strand:+ start:9995 stop:12499 length:2505 start_codon:yes stop_codon:yes gene_type:complete
MTNFHKTWYNFVREDKEVSPKPTLTENTDIYGKIDEKLLRELTEDEVDHIEDVLSSIDPDEMPFNNLFQGNMRLILPFNTLDMDTDIGRFIKFWDNLYQGYDEERQETIGWKWEPDFSTGKATRSRPLYKTSRDFKNADKEYTAKKTDALARDLTGGVIPDEWTKVDTPKRSPETMKIGKILNKIANLIAKYREYQKPRGEKLSSEEQTAANRLYNALYNLTGNTTKVDRIIANPEQVQNFARWWELTGAGLFKGDKNAGKNNNYSIIVTRSPIDVLRMADFDNIQSCHSPPSRGGQAEYYKCAVAEAQGHGAIAYIVKTEDLFNEYDGKTLEEIQNDEDFQTEEVFWDKERSEGRITPLSRVRLRQMRYWDKTANPEDKPPGMSKWEWTQASTPGTDLAVPEARVYGQKFEDFRKTMVRWASENQEEQLKNAPRKDGKVNLDRFVKYGGSYEDNTSGTLVMDLFPPDTEAEGRIEQNTKTEDELDANILGGMRDRWIQECDDMTTSYNNRMQACEVGYEIEDDGGGLYIEVKATMYIKWDEDEWEKWPNAQDVSYLLMDAKEYGWFQWMNPDYPSSFQKIGKVWVGADQVGFFFAIEPNENTWDHGHVANDPTVYEEWCQTIDRLDDGYDQIKAIISKVAKQHGWMKGGKFLNFAQEVHNGDIQSYEWEMEADGDYDETHEITAAAKIQIPWSEVVFNFGENVDRAQMLKILESRELRLAFRKDILTDIMKENDVPYWLQVGGRGFITDGEEGEWEMEYWPYFLLTEDDPEEMIEVFKDLVEGDTDDEDHLRDSLIISIQEVMKENQIQENISRYSSKDDKFFVKRWKANFKR